MPPPHLLRFTSQRSKITFGKLNFTCIRNVISLICSSITRCTKYNTKFPRTSTTWIVPSSLDEIPYFVGLPKLNRFETV